MLDSQLEEDYEDDWEVDEEFPEVEEWPEIGQYYTPETKEKE